MKRIEIPVIDMVRTGARINAIRKKCGILKTHQPGDDYDDMGSYSARAGAIVLDKSEEVLNIEAISSSSMKLKVISYSNRRAAFYDGDYIIFELKKGK